MRLIPKRGVNMNGIEKDVITLLQEDSRLSPERLASMLGISAEKARATVKQLEDSGAIVKYTAIVNDNIAEEEKVEALIEVKVTPQRGAGFDAIACEIAAHDEVKNLYLMSGGYDLAVIVECKSLKGVARFVSERISTYDTVLSTATHFILKKYKIEGALMNRGEGPDRMPVQP